uniref:Uncharacterized protein n=1 Tax=Ostreococcus mediterraneus TaxID=1486918 RepID=A0A7S0PQL2_9CHLO|mmetsp:Transcript_7280/g.26576  ORF Transcript_7280/g.26576 Transcript_7280/m.26576 type:complete len:125 (+) Transcript_7280:43-417(+)
MMTTNGAYVVNQPGVMHVMAPPTPVVHYQGASTTTVMMPNQLVPNGVYVQEPYVGPISMVLGVCLLGFLCPLVFFCPCDTRTTFVPAVAQQPQVTHVYAQPQTQQMTSAPKIVPGTPTNYYPSV